MKFPNLLAEMARNGHTQKTLADLLNTNISSICRRLSGEIEWAKYEIDQICEFYGKSYEDLFR